MTDVPGHLTKVITKRHAIPWPYHWSVYQSISVYQLSTRNATNRRSPQKRDIDYTGYYWWRCCLAVNGIQEVRGSIPLGSTNKIKKLDCHNPPHLKSHITTVSPKSSKAGVCCSAWPSRWRGPVQ